MHNTQRFHWQDSSSFAFVDVVYCSCLFFLVSFSVFLTMTLFPLSFFTYTLSSPSHLSLSMSLTLFISRCLHLSLIICLFISLNKPILSLFFAFTFFSFFFLSLFFSFSFFFFFFLSLIIFLFCPARRLSCFGLLPFLLSAIRKFFSSFWGYFYDSPDSFVDFDFGLFLLLLLFSRIGDDDDQTSLEQQKTYHSFKMIKIRAAEQYWSNLF